MRINKIVYALASLAALALAVGASWRPFKGYQSARL
jgi:hypothetical protein